MIWIVLLFFLFVFMLIALPQKGVRVLMYHKISRFEKDFLTVTTEQLDNQLKYLQRLDYQWITAQNLLDFYFENKPLPAKSVLLTFDDGYLNNLEWAYPILKKYNAKATIFIPTAFVGKVNAWDNGSDAIMTVEQLRGLDPSVFELALHTHTHRNFADLTIEEVETEMLQNTAFFAENGLAYILVLAYPYGGRPEGELNVLMKKSLKKMGIVAAFRIGNRVNPLKIKDLYDLNRIDIRGTDGFWRFRLKVKFGKIGLF